MHPELKRKVGALFEQEASCAKRARELLLATESAWVILGYSDRAPEASQVWSLASIAAGLLEAEGKPGAHAEAVRLRLIQGGLGVVASSNEHEEVPEG